ncbi:MAG: sensor domain-containing diguanylate cyclase [Smithella sp.]|jgi:diguanylate cyclase (GGDEF)-like protein
MNLLRKISINVYNLLTGTKNALLYRVLFLSLLTFPVVILTVIDYTNTNRDITKSILAERRSLSTLAANTLDENLDKIVEVSIAYTTRPKVIEYVEKGDWKGALSIASQAQDLFPYFDRILIYNPEGVIKADTPHAIPNVIGLSRADRKWYNIVKNSWKPYLSGIYIRSSEPKIPVVSVIVPIKTITPKTAGNLTSSSEQKVLGILQFQVKLDIFNDWINRIDIGPGGRIFIVDQHGNLVYHTRYLIKRTVTDFSSVPVVAKLLKGLGGAEENYNPIEKENRLDAYEPVPAYGWGVVITQPIELAFIKKNERLNDTLIVHSIIIVLVLLIALIILHSMITYRKAEITVQHMAYHDFLIGLPNRKLFSDRLNIAIAQAQRNQKKIGIAMLDLDNFKVVNDTLGHYKGDLLLKATTQRLHSVIRKGDTIARFGGDEFVLILPDLAIIEDATQIAQKIIDSFCNPFLIDSHQLVTTTSIGIVVYPNDGTTEDLLLRNADIAMYQAKQEGRNQYQLYKNV